MDSFAKTPQELHREEQIKKWNTFYRLNIHIFAEEGLHIKLKFYQRIILYFMNTMPFFMWIAARGTAKSFISGVYAVCRAILYPNSQIVLAASTINQAGLIITTKIKGELMPKYPLIRMEIKKVEGGKEPKIVFHNGSVIKAVASNEGARGNRSNLTIYDEFRLIDKDIVDKILVPFQRVRRQPPYLSNPKYQTPEWKFLKEHEPNMEVYISSAHLKSSWMWDSMSQTIRAMAASISSGIDITKGIFALDYHASILDGLTTKTDAEADMAKVDEITALMEYKNIMFGQNEDAFFDFTDLNSKRILEVPFYCNNLEWIKKEDKLLKGEIRILGVDVALVGGSDNDKTAIVGIRLIPQGERYLRRVAFVETISGITRTQSIRIKQMFHDFKASRIIVDTNGNGMAIHDDLILSQYDPDRNREYEAWSAYNDKKMSSRHRNSSALPIMYSMKANADINSKIAFSLRNAIRSGYIEFLLPEASAESRIAANHSVYKENVEEYLKYLEAYRETSALITEMVNLDFTIQGDKVKVSQKSNARKDRYSALAYANKLADDLEFENLRVEKYKYDETKALVLW